MTGRYESTDEKNRFDKKRVLRTTIYPEIPKRADDIYIYAQEGDRLDVLAYKYYKDQTAWWIIAVANQISGTMSVPPGTQLRIPINISRIYAELETLNRNR